MRLTSYFHWLWKSAKGIRLCIAGNALAGTFHVVASLLFIGISKHLIDIATGRVGGAFMLYAGLLVACVLLQLLFFVLTGRWGTLAETRLVNSLRCRFFRHVMMSRWTGREQMHTGDMLNRLEGDTELVAGLLARTVPAVWVTSVRLLSAFLFLWWLDVRLAVCLMLIMPVALLASKRYIRQVRRLTKEIRATDSRVQTHLQEHLQHRILISTLERTDDVSGQLDFLQADLYGQIRKRMNFTLFSRTVVQFGFASGYTLAFLWGVYGLWQGSVTFGMMTAFLQLVGQVQRPMAELGSQLPAFVHALISVERLVELEELPAEERGTPFRLQGVPGIRMERISFAYPHGARNVIEDFSCDFLPGSLTAIVGETGTGKSTLMRLMLALLKPDKGRVILYDHRCEAEASSLTRNNIVYVPQGNTLLSGTVRDNLLLGDPRATEQEMFRALHLAAADFVLRLPEGLDTPCGEQGAGFSEGQAQRIAVARGLLRPGNILLLDEPTSSLDGDTEQTLLRRLSGQMTGKTLIIITHREAVAAFCTHIIRL